MVGLAKELQDTHDGSGFSFNDLAADEAGALFGKIAISDRDHARRVQDVLRQTEDESQFIPVLKDLPESMDADEFSEKFTSIGSPAYEAVRSEIRQRILDQAAAGLVREDSAGDGGHGQRIDEAGDDRHEQDHDEGGADFLQHGAVLGRIRSDEADGHDRHVDQLDADEGDDHAAQPIDQKIAQQHG